MNERVPAIVEQPERLLVSVAHASHQYRVIQGAIAAWHHQYLARRGVRWCLGRWIHATVNVRVQLVSRPGKTVGQSDRQTVGLSDRLTGLMARAQVTSSCIPNMPTMRRPALIALLLAAACHRAVAPIDTAPVAQQMSEANVVAIILAANNTDLSYARLATERSTNMAVRTFAQRMTLDHTILNNRTTEIAQRSGITPEDNERSLEFRDKSASRRDELRDLQGAKFDSVYAANEIVFHNEFLGLLDKVLVPNAHTLELREFVRNLRPAMSAHLGHAEEMRASVARARGK